MKKRAVHWALFLIFPILLGINTVRAQFSDIQKDSLTYLYRHNVIEAGPGNTFKPTEPLPRDEMLEIIFKAHLIPLKSVNQACFNDVAPDHPRAPYICTAKENGWIKGYPDNTFKPDEKVSKIEALQTLSAIQNWIRYVSEPGFSFTDVPKDAWYYDYVKWAYIAGYIDDAPRFYPARAITREEFAEILFRTIVAEKMSAKPIVDLPMTARNFFKIENIAQQQRYEDFKDADQYVDVTGNIYAVKHLQVDLETHSNRPSHYVPHTLMIAKFTPDKKLDKFTWHHFYELQPRTLDFSIASVVRDKVEVEMKYHNAFVRTKTYILESLRKTSS